MTEAEFVQRTLASNETRLHRVLIDLEPSIDDWIYDNWEWLQKYISNVRYQKSLIDGGTTLRFMIMHYEWAAFADDSYYNLLKEMLPDAT